MVSKIRLGYEGKFYDAFDVMFYDKETDSLLTRRAVDKRLDEKLFGPDGDYVDKTAQAIDEEIFYFLSDEEMQKSLDDIECIIYCVYYELDYVGDCQYKGSDGTVHKYQPYQAEER